MSRPTSYQPEPSRRLLPVTPVPGMPVYEITGIPAGEIVAITQQYCLYRLPDTDQLVVANWTDLALGHVCPAEPLLPADVTENDQRNAAATTLRELLALREFAVLTAAQQTAMDELLQFLTGS